jgi:6-phosphogluconolactonase
MGEAKEESLKKQKYTRRSFLEGVGLIMASLPFAAYGKFSSQPENNDKSFIIYVGTYSKPDKNSIYGLRLNSVTGKMTRIFSEEGLPNASFMVLDAKGDYLYAVNETGDFKGDNSGAIGSFAINQSTGKLSILNVRQSFGGYPCYVSMDYKNNLVLIANYMGGNVVIYPVRSNGKLKEMADIAAHRVDVKNKNSSRAHCFLPDPFNRFYFSVDLGLDKIFKFQLKPKTKSLKEYKEPAFIAKPGTGPRMLTFHPNGLYAYLICELDSSIYALSYESDLGNLKELQHITTLPKGYSDKNTCAHVQISPNGKFLYGSNRGHNSIVVYSIEENTGTLNLVQHVDTQGKIPKNFIIEPTGKILLAANQKSNNIISFHIDQKTGKLIPTGFKIEVPSPIFLLVRSS